MKTAVLILMSIVGFLLVVEPASALIINPSGSSDRASVTFTIEASDWNTISPTESLAPYNFNIRFADFGEDYNVESHQGDFEVSNYGDMPTFTVTSNDTMQGLNGPFDVWGADLLDGNYPFPVAGYGVDLLPVGSTKYFTIISTSPTPNTTSTLVYANEAVNGLFDGLSDLLMLCAYVFGGLLSITLVFWAWGWIMRQFI